MILAPVVAEKNIREPLKTPVEHLERQVYLQSTVYFL